MTKPRRFQSGLFWHHPLQPHQEAAPTAAFNYYQAASNKKSRTFSLHRPLTYSFKFWTVWSSLPNFNVDAKPGLVLAGHLV